MSRLQTAKNEECFLKLLKSSGRRRGLLRAEIMPASSSAPASVEATDSLSKLLGAFLAKLGSSGSETRAASSAKTGNLLFGGTCCPFSSSR